MSDSHNLERFAKAQEGIVETVGRELSEGQKRSHWMWYVFPQVRGLGRSMMSEQYGIASLEEARAYLEHPVLGPRLREWTELAVKVEDKSAEAIFGYPDYLKFRSSMTLFSRVAEEDSVFHRALEKYYDGRPDSKTLQILRLR